MSLSARADRPKYGFRGEKLKVAKAKKAYVCEECGAHSVKWAGQCPDCAAWNTLTETTVGPAKAVGTPRQATTIDALSGDIDTRHSTGFGELDRVLGGGLVPGAVVLLGGDPGVGKSTLLQQASAHLMQDMDVCYATGEESLRQIGQRSQRLGLDAASMNLLSDTSLENVLSEAQRCKAKVIVIDSIQTMTSDEVPSAPGSVTQLREGVGRNRAVCETKRRGRINYRTRYKRGCDCRAARRRAHGRHGSLFRKRSIKSVHDDSIGLKTDSERVVRWACLR